jgi:hypothetical protein
MKLMRSQLTDSKKTAVTQSVLIAATLLLVTGCATDPSVVATEQDRMTQSGFLTNYKALKEDKGLQGLQCWNVPDLSADAKRYNKIMISPIDVSLAPPTDKPDPSKAVDPNAKPATPDPIDSKDLKMLTDYFQGELDKSFKPQMEVVNTVSPGVVVMRVALTNLKPTSVVGSVIGTATPFGYVAEVGSGVATGRPAGSTPYLGETSIELQFVDGLSKKVLAECRDTEIGRKYAADLNAGASGAATTWASGYLTSFQQWEYAKDAFNKWATVLSVRVAKLRGVELKLAPQTPVQAQPQPKS